MEKDNKSEMLVSRLRPDEKAHLSDRADVLHLKSASDYVAMLILQDMLIQPSGYEKSLSIQQRIGNIMRWKETHEHQSTDTNI